MFFYRIDVLVSLVGEYVYRLDVDVVSNLVKFVKSVGF